MIKFIMEFTIRTRFEKYALIFLLNILMLIFFLILFYGVEQILLYLKFRNTDLVVLLKEMAYKNHNNPSLFLEKYRISGTKEEQLKIELINQFYECVYNNMDAIKTKQDINKVCGQFIRF